MGLCYDGFVRVIALGTIKAFLNRSAGVDDAREPVMAWFRQVRQANWTKPADVKRDVRSASIITHRHPEAVAGATAIAYLVARAASTSVISSGVSGWQVNSAFALSKPAFVVRKWSRLLRELRCSPESWWLSTT